MIAAVCLAFLVASPGASPAPARTYASLRATLVQRPAEKVKAVTVRARPEAPAEPLTFTPAYGPGPNLAANDRAMAELVAACDQAGITNQAGPEIAAALQNGHAAMRRMLSEAKEQRIDPNTGLEKDKWTIRDYGMNRVGFEVQFELVEEVYASAGASAKETILTTITHDLGTVDVPLAVNVLSSETLSAASTTDIQNIIGGIKFAPPNADQAGLGSVALPRLRGLDAYTSKLKPMTSESYMREVTSMIPVEVLSSAYLNTGYKPADVLKYISGMAAQGDDMNALRVPGDMGVDWPDCGSEMNFPIGTMWMPSEAGYQAMTNYQPISLRMNFGTGGEYPPQVLPVSGRTHCVTMDLKEPAPGIRYFPYLPADETMVGLSKITSQSLFRGPWDQARTWMYTSKASRPEINERLTGFQVTSGQYVNNMYDICRVRGYNQADFKNRKIFDPSLLDCVTANDAAFSWFASQVTETFPKETAAWLRSAPPSLVNLIAAPKDELDQKHPIRLLQTTLNSGQPEVRRASLELLDKTEGRDDRLKGQLGSFLMSRYSQDASEAELSSRIFMRLRF